jgi:hypothetical protein
MNFFILLESSVKIFDLCLNVVNLAHIYRLIKQMLTLHLIVVLHLSIGSLAWS